MQQSHTFRESADSRYNIPEVHPVFIVIVGTSMIEQAVILTAQQRANSDPVPHRIVAIDSLPYEDVVTRFQQNGWSRDHVLAALPRANYFQLTSPFVEGFDFDDPLNRDWQNTIYEPRLRHLASKPDSPGCAGTPALGRARVEANEQNLRTFLEGHSQGLTQVRPETLGLLPGIKAFVVTTFRGGTGTGATIPVAAILRSVLTEGSIHLTAVMPDVYSGDRRAISNAYASLCEMQAAHCYNAGVTLKNGIVLPAPFETVSPIFASNGMVTLGPRDALMQIAGTLGRQLQARTQSTINSRAVDMTDITPFTINDEPMHIRVESAVSIRNIQPQTLPYLGAAWCLHVLEAQRASLEDWCVNNTLSFEENEVIAEIAQSALRDLNIDLPGLLARIDPAPGAANVVRNAIEQATLAISNMSADNIKTTVANIPGVLRSQFLKFEPVWKERARAITQSLPEEIINYVSTRLADAPHLVLATLTRLSERLVTLSKTMADEAETKKKRRDAFAAQLGQALSDAQEAGGILWVFRRDEVARDAALTVLNLAMNASLARIEQQRLEYLHQAFNAEQVSVDGRGRTQAIQPVLVVIRNTVVSLMAQFRKHQEEQINEVKAILDELGQGIEKRSPVFQRTLLYDDVNLNKLHSIAVNIAEIIPDAPAITQLLRGELSINDTINALLPLLPAYAEAGRSLADVLEEDAGKRSLVLQLLRNRTPFTPLDRVVEDQQGLRRDRDNLLVLEVPGGADGSLAALMLREGIVGNPNQIVDSGEDEIRLYYLREGIPYAAVRPLVRYKEQHNAYLADPNAITPYTHAKAHSYPNIEPSRVNVRTHTEQIIYQAMAVLPDRLVSHPAGGFTLKYEKARFGLSVSEQATFADFQSVVLWLAKHVSARKAFENELKDLLNAAPEQYTTKLLEAWRTSSDKEREYLQETLYSLGVDPAKAATPIRPLSEVDSNGQQPSYAGD